MAYVFRPGLWRDTTVAPLVGDRFIEPEVISSGVMFWLPQPVTSLPFGAEWKGRAVEPRLKDGAEAVRGNKLKTRTESISGLIGREVPTDPEDPIVRFLTTGDMYEKFADFVAFVDTKDYPLELFVFYDEVTSTYVKYKGVYAASLKTDLGDSQFHVIPWNLQVVITDPKIYTTAPGA